MSHGKTIISKSYTQTIAINYYRLLLLKFTRTFRHLKINLVQGTLSVSFWSFFFFLLHSSICETEYNICEKINRSPSKRNEFRVVHSLFDFSCVLSPFVFFFAFFLSGADRSVPDGPRWMFACIRAIVATQTANFTYTYLFLIMHLAGKTGWTALLYRRSRRWLLTVMLCSRWSIRSFELSEALN